MSKELTLDQVIDLLRQLVASEGSNTAAAKRIGVTSAFVGQVLNGKKEPGPKMLEFFGIERETKNIYRRK